MCDALQPFIYGKKCNLYNLYIACLVSPPFLALRKHYVLGEKCLLSSGLFPHPFHPIYSPQLTSNKAVQSGPLTKRTLLPHPICFVGVCMSSATLLMNGCSKPELLWKTLSDSFPA